MHPQPYRSSAACPLVCPPVCPSSDTRFLRPLPSLALCAVLRDEVVQAELRLRNRLARNAVSDYAQTHAQTHALRLESIECRLNSEAKEEEEAASSEARLEGETVPPREAAAKAATEGAPEAVAKQRAVAVQWKRAEMQNTIKILKTLEQNIALSRLREPARVLFFEVCYAVRLSCARVIISDALCFCVHVLPVPCFARVPSGLAVQRFWSRRSAPVAKNAGTEGRTCVLR